MEPSHRSRCKRSAPSAGQRSAASGCGVARIAYLGVFHLLKNMFFSPVGFKGIVELLFTFFPGDLSKWKVFDSPG